ncbi:AAA+-type ATPase [Yamadazyma tenuis]|uniref:AAA+ ATPase domain-containing protein n=1 Tax=Candida tenuis (strain ATCC 10573 / BCRC 21748 / CBS 615 / JCM 9827 / NBRC 10315 / NRRL Y-1498 / VKM Y-70) TaxID=590646 RepID=G3AXB6_CANTC|nr:uncharacterized protein CANTEDRAFT_128774 [Yamadazyma tenuis ATCC 10573]EGV66334.1 hypothetical protein CANTEDRAFT_128774 [Yamadazyma tenuis ATCC 10573]WEJ95539.1 AAA+-type ATPase [Yamadazyma tenuis]
MSSKSNSKNKKNASTPTPSEAPPRKVKIPKAYVVRPAVNLNPKSTSKVYIHQDIFEALELKNSDIVYICKSESGEPGVLASIHSDADIMDTNVIFVSAGLRSLSGILLGDRVLISKYMKQPQFANRIHIHYLGEAEESSLKKIEKVIDEIGLVAPGLQINGIELGETNVSIRIIDIENPQPLEDSLQDLSFSSKISSQDVSSDTITPYFLFSKGNGSVQIVSTDTIDTTKYPNFHRRTNFDQVGGLSKQISLLQSTIEVPLHNPQLFSEFGISPPRGILLHGPPGTGKTMLLKCVAQNIDAHVLSINGPSIVSKYLGETENAIREIFLEARKYQPSIIFMDEVDSLVPSRTSEDSGETESRVVATLLTMMDGMNDTGRVVVVGATNRPNSIDSALRRPGRFDQEVEIGIPDAEDRFDILSKLVGKMNQAKFDLSEEDIRSVSSKTHGYVGADLSALCRESVMKAINRGLKNGISQSDIKLTVEDMLSSLPDIRPSAMREIFLEMPKVHWSDIGGQHELKRKLVEVVQLPLEAAETFNKLGVSAPKGVLLYGPPGCSKTLTAKALATESGLNFLAVKGPEIFNKYVGESERAIREIFRKARAASPSIIFFDEIDAISGDRESANTSAAQQVLTSLLNEIDGVEELKGVVIVGATNRPTEIDPALLRPGRLDRHIFVGPPDYEARLEILKKCCFKFNLTEDVSLHEMATATEGCSGAEVTLLCQESGLAAIMENNNASSVSKKHFEHALKGISKGITEEMLNYYTEFSQRSGLSV